jgi:flagellar hook-basal body complex protein FliE
MRVESVQMSRLVNPSELGEISRPAASGLLDGTLAPDNDFSQVLGKALGQVNNSLAEADHQSLQVATGEAKDLHGALTAVAEADLALQVTLRVVQKALSAYQEISRMQI